MEIPSAMSASCIHDAATCPVSQESNMDMHGRSRLCKKCGQRRNRNWDDSNLAFRRSEHCESGRSKNQVFETIILCRCKYQNISRCTPSFFKIACLLLTLHIASVEAYPSGLPSPVLRSLFSTSTTHRAGDGNNLELLRRTPRSFNFHHTLFQTRTHLPQRHDETRTCEDFVANLSQMHKFAQIEARRIYNRTPRKRGAAEIVHRSWGEVCSHAYREYVAMECYITHHAPHLFKTHTSDVKAALKSMITLVQQEMNRINHHYRITTCTTNRDFTMGQYVSSRNMLSNMFVVTGLVNQKCRSDPQATVRSS